MSAAPAFPLEARFVGAGPAFPAERMAAAQALLPPGAMLRTLTEAWAGGRRAVATLNLPAGTAPAAAELEALFTGLARTLAAVQAGLYHPLHRQAALLPAANRLAASQGIIPPPGAALPGPPEGMPPEAEVIALPVPHLALDLARLPEAVWWLNLWGAPVLAGFPPGAVAAAPWFRQAALDDAMLLQACDAPPGPAHPEAFAAVQAITEALGLHALQRAAAGDQAP